MLFPVDAIAADVCVCVQHTRAAFCFVWNYVSSSNQEDQIAFPFLESYSSLIPSPRYVLSQLLKAKPLQLSVSGLLRNINRMQMGMGILA